MGMFKMSDIIILLIGIFISLCLMFLIEGDSIAILVIKLLPLALAVLLVLPIPYYHNVLTYIQEVVNYVQSQKEYKWRGWCAYREFGDRK
jgi:Gpi18-like mannosyltransferase